MFVENEVGAVWLEEPRVGLSQQVSKGIWLSNECEDISRMK